MAAPQTGKGKAVAPEIEIRAGKRHGRPKGGKNRIAKPWWEKPMVTLLSKESCIMKMEIPRKEEQVKESTATASLSEDEPQI